MTEHTPGQIVSASDALQFIYGGNATFTLKSNKTEARYTYKVRQSNYDQNQFFVSYLTGQDNENDYAYIGMIRWKVFGITKKSKLLLDSKPIAALKWTLDQLQLNGKMPDQLEFWHEGRCCKCNRKLTVPESIANGIGPECAKQRETA